MIFLTHRVEPELGKRGRVELVDLPPDGSPPVFLLLFFFVSFL